MPKYRFEANYTPEGVRGLKDAGAASRAKALDEMATALNLEEADAAMSRSVNYRPPGS